jgi:hypothetical protein
MGLNLALIITIFLTRERWDAWVAENRFRGGWTHQEVIAVSPDSRRAIVHRGHGMDSFLVLWDIQTSRSLAYHLTRHASSATFSPDGTKILAIVPAAGDRNEAVLLDAETGERNALLASTKGMGNLESCSFSLDGRFVIHAGNVPDGRAHIWSATDGSHVMALGEEGGAIHDAEFSPGGGTVLTVALESDVRLWDAHSGELLWRIDDEDDQRAYARFCVGGQNVLVCSDQRTLLVEAASGIPLVALGACFPTVVSGTGREIVVHYESASTVALLDATNGDTLFETQLDGVRSFRFADGGRRLLVERRGDRRDVVTVLDARTGKALGEFPYDHKAPLTLSPDRMRILARERGRLARLHSTRTGSLLAEWAGMRPVGFLGNDRVMLQGSREMEDGRILRRVRPEEWWGVVALWHFWLIVAIGGALAWSGWRDIKRMRGTATGIQQGCAGYAG